MENKRFCDLVVCDNVFSKINNEIETNKIKHIEKVKNILKKNIIRFNFYSDCYLDFYLDENKYFESDFIVINENIFISTSLDRLLLETSY